jgi:hypothetical protein
MSVSLLFQVLEQALFLLGQSIFVCLAGVATQKTLGVATVQGMMLGILVWFTHGHTGCSGNLDLSGHCYISLVPSPAVDKSG